MIPALAASSSLFLFLLGRGLRCAERFDLAQLVEHPLSSPGVRGSSATGSAAGATGSPARCASSQLWHAATSSSGSRALAFLGFTSDRSVQKPSRTPNFQSKDISRIGVQLVTSIIYLGRRPRAHPPKQMSPQAHNKPTVTYLYLITIAFKKWIDNTLSKAFRRQVLISGCQKLRLSLSLTALTYSCTKHRAFLVQSFKSAVEPAFQ